MEQVETDNQAKNDRLSIAVGSIYEKEIHLLPKILETEYSHQEQSQSS